MDIFLKFIVYDCPLDRKKQLNDVHNILQSYLWENFQIRKCSNSKLLLIFIIHWTVNELNYFKLITLNSAWPTIGVKKKGAAFVKKCWAWNHWSIKW